MAAALPPRPAIPPRPPTATPMEATALFAALDNTPDPEPEPEPDPPPDEPEDDTALPPDEALEPEELPDVRAPAGIALLIAAHSASNAEIAKLTSAAGQVEWICALTVRKLVQRLGRLARLRVSLK